MLIFKCLQSLQKVETLLSKGKCWTSYWNIKQSDKSFRILRHFIPVPSLSCTTCCWNHTSSNNIQKELAGLQCHNILKTKIQFLHFKNFFLSNSSEVSTLYGSTYICEEFFSVTKFNNCHPGTDRLINTSRQHLVWSHLSRYILTSSLGWDKMLPD